MSLKDDLDAASARREDGGLIHHGWVHFIQCGLADEEGFDDGFILKAAIYQVVEAVPDVFPLDLPERVDADDFAVTEAMGLKHAEINATLIMPIGGWEIVQIIRKAREYLAQEAAE